MIDKAADFSDRGDVGEFGVLDNNICKTLEFVLYSKDDDKLVQEAPAQIMNLDDNPTTFQKVFFTQYLNDTKTYVLKYRAVGDNINYLDSDWQYRELNIGKADDPLTAEQDTAFSGLYNGWLGNFVEYKDDKAYYGLRLPVDKVTGIKVKDGRLTFNSASLDGSMEKLEELEWTKWNILNSNDTSYIEKYRNETGLSYRIRVFKDGNLIDIIETEKTDLDISHYIKESGDYTFGVTAKPDLLFTLKEVYNENRPTTYRTALLNSEEVISPMIEHRLPQLSTVKNFKLKGKQLTWDLNPEAGAYTITTYKDGNPIGEPKVLDNRTTSMDIDDSLKGEGSYFWTIETTSYIEGFDSSSKVKSETYTVNPIENTAKPIEKPDKDTKEETKGANTGDSSHIWLYAGLMIAAILIGGFVVWRRKSR